MLRQARRMREKIRRQFLSGTRTSTRQLKKRSGNLFDSTVIGKRTNTATRSSVDVDIRKPYAATHFGVRGQRTTIRPRRAKALAIPLRAARDGRGVPLGNPMDSRFQPSFIQNGVIFKRDGSQSRPVTPLFVLKDSVTVRARIDLIRDLQRPAVRPLERAIAGAVVSL